MEFGSFRALHAVSRPHYLVYACVLKVLDREQWLPWVVSCKGHVVGWVPVASINDYVEDGVFLQRIDYRYNLRCALDRK